VISATINDSQNNLYPFPEELWDNPEIVYHGTWSVYSARIETDGFVHPDLPFDDRHVATVMHAREALGMGFRAANFFSTSRGKARAELSMTGNFWGARVYATDGGGEVIRLTIKDATDFESFCASPDRRSVKRSEWEEALRQHPTHLPTRKTLELLKNDAAMDVHCANVRSAREAIENVIAGGFPVVYALRVKPQWFPTLWEPYMYQWQDDHRGKELQCPRELITADRIVAKAMYPKGTDKDFQPEGFETWKHLGLLPWLTETVT
jgi:hypothetical protein